MQDSPLVSVILPTYNRAELLRRAINSVLIQTYPDWELIIWDDGSTDDSEKMVWAYHNGRIRYYRDTNHGVAHARNRAIEASRGEYLAFLDSDDEWVSDKLAAQVNVMNAHPGIDVLFGNFLNRNGSARQDQSAFEQYSSVMELLTVDKMDGGLVIIKGGLPQSLAVENFIATDSVMIRRETLNRVGCFAEELRNSEDFELWWRIGLAGFCFAFLNNVYLTRYKLAGNLSSSSILTCKNALKGLDLCLQEAKSKGRSDLTSYLNVAFRNTWQNLIPLYAKSGNNQGMLISFFQSMKYGIRLGSIRLFVEAILNQNRPGK